MGLALGYMSNVIPIFCIAFTIFVSFSYANMYGIALAALGMLGTLPIALTIDSVMAVSDNAEGIAEMAGLHKNVRASTDKLDAAGNTTAAVGKGFAIGSATLVALALFGAFVTRTQRTQVNVLAPIQFTGLLIGAMIPYWFSAMTMKAVGLTAQEMMIEIKRQFEEKEAHGTPPDYQKCISISTTASLKMMIAPGVLVILSPLIMGFFFVLTQSLVFSLVRLFLGVQIAISASNTGGAWDNAKKYIEAGNLD